VLLTPEEINFVAQKAQWYFDVQTQPFSGENSVIITGDGVDDLDRMLSLFDIHHRMVVTVDVGRGSSDHRPCSLSDIQAIRAAFVGFHGEVDRVPASVRPPSAFET
jgi:hypothetical protein